MMLQNQYIGWLFHFWSLHDANEREESNDCHGSRVPLNVNLNRI